MHNLLLSIFLNFLLLLPFFNLGWSQEISTSLPPSSATPAMVVDPASTTSTLLSIQENKETFLIDLGAVISSHSSEFIDILTQVDNVYGAKYEIGQVLKTLKGAPVHEFPYLKDSTPLNSVAIFGSRNIPLYTLIMHGIIPSLASKNVWFKTPELTRSIYMQLFQKIQQLLPQYDFSPLHMLHQGKDVQYDNFRKMYILGLNSDGKKVVRPPADVVIFIGSPERGDEVLATISDKVEKSPHLFPEFKQIFLKFGSGLNPVIVSEYATHNLSQVVGAVIESIKINNSQDCISPKFYAVHSSQTEDFTKQLIPSLKKLKFGALNDPDADYTSLAFTQNLSDLVAYREKHLMYLQNPEAIIDTTPEVNRVDPHFFLFPFSKFKEVELKDHYAPFVVAFTYDSEEEYRQLANDERVRDRAMYACVFGDSSRFEMWKVRKKLEDNFHCTTLNNDIYKEESGNFPFGGYSSKASSVTLLQKRPTLNKSDGTTKNVLNKVTFARPLLFSKEVKEFFPVASSITTPTLPGSSPLSSAVTTPTAPSTSSSYTSFDTSFPVDERILKQKEQNDLALERILKESLDISLRDREIPKYYFSLQNPFFDIASRPHGLEFLRKEIAKKGISRVVVDSPPSTTEEKREMEEFHGMPVHYSPYLPGRHLPSFRWKKTRQVPGVVLHNLGIGWSTIQGLNHVRGTINPLLGYGHLVPLVEDRENEYRIANSIWPGIMATSFSFTDIKQMEKDSYIDKGLDPSDSELPLSKANQYKEQTINLINSMVKNGEYEVKTLAQLKNSLKQMIHETFQMVQSHVPKGTFAKNYGESTTGDLGIQITTFHYNADNMADQFIHSLQTAGGQYTKGINDSFWQEKMRSSYYATSTKFLLKFLIDPKNIIFQERLKIAKTMLGQNVEIRVDFLEGEAVNAKGRYSIEYMREEEEQAKLVINEFFKKAPLPFQYLPGGADLVRLEDGSWKIIEFNFGPNSGASCPQTFPCDAHRYISQLQGKNTVFLQKLEDLFQSPLLDQKEHLLKLAQTMEEEKWHKENLADISLAEVAKWMRDRYLDEWRKYPTAEKAVETYKQLQELFQGVGSEYNRDLPLLLLGTKNYLQQKMLISLE